MTAEQTHWKQALEAYTASVVMNFNRTFGIAGVHATAIGMSVDGEGVVTVTLTVAEEA